MGLVALWLSVSLFVCLSVFLSHPIKFIYFFFSHMYVKLAITFLFYVFRFLLFPP